MALVHGLLACLIVTAAAQCSGGPQSFFFNSVSHNNLGGAGPDAGDPQDLIFDKVTYFQDRCVKLDIGPDADGGSAPYESQNAYQNGAATDEHLGRINLMSGTSASLLFTLRDCETNRKVELPRLNLTFYALSVNKERSITVDGYTAAFQASNVFEKAYTDAGTTFTETGSCQGPLNSPGCALTFYFDKVSEIPIYLQVPGVKGFGHLFYFSASMCNGVEMPHGRCAASVCGQGYELKSNVFGMHCSGAECTQDECCHRERTGQIAFPLVQSCAGTERSWRTCQDLPECHPCYPIHCMFDEWSEWKPVGGCSGLCVRDRTPGENNECGNPCSGPTQETVARLDDPLCYPPSCGLKNRDCVWGQWEEWSKCGHEQCVPCMLGQRYRSRKIFMPELGNGKPCAGAWNETEPCEASHARDCVMSQWNEWTSCSKSCGMGWMVRMRRVIQEAKYGGKACGADEYYNQGLVTRQTEPCNTHSCGHAVPCVLSEWSEWDGCHHISPYQKFRFRDVLQTEMHGGKPCDVDLNETAGCPEPDTDKPKPPCVLEAWTEWSSCSATCGGQMHRSRRVIGEPCVLHGQASNTGAPLHETMACGHRECSHESCHLSIWDEWSPCSTTCGIGATFRSRKILEIGDTNGCNTGLEEVRACSERMCSGIDCLWGAWEEWGACTCTCDGGIKRRNRIIKVAPRHGGRLCSPEDKNEVAPCNTQSCDECIDGAWSTWSEWGSCSSDCAPAFRVRHRNVAVHPNSCGKPASGLEDEYQMCDHLPACVPDQDCQLSAWGQWSDCSSKCFGVRERQRNVAQYARGHGKSCTTDSLKEVNPCNPGTGEAAPLHCKPDKMVDCVLGSWEQWSGCSRTCDGGQKNRGRHILSPAVNGGQPCADKLEETQPCNQDPCSQTPCIDCVWAAWSKWGDCTKCGGQRFRHRNIQTLPNKCGKPCDMKSSKELGQCESHCEKKFFCVWSGWERMGGCSKTCGSGTRLRQRQLTLTEHEPVEGTFFVARADSSCSGNQIDTETCDGLPSCESCTAQDCIFNPWSEWSAPTCTQLCERHRTVAKESACGGILCTGPLIETKRCPHNCNEKRDCKFGDWGDWSGHCDSSTRQRERHRSIAEPAMNDGAQCEGDTKQTMPCGGIEKLDCEVDSWGQWSACTADCDGGVATRSRSILQNSQGGGSPCTASLSEVTQCNMEPCRRDVLNCMMGAWDAWTSCQDASMSFRFRRIVQQPANGGRVCHGSLREAQSCLNRVDCEVSGWTRWDACDKTCGGGQRTRQRQVTTNPLNGGKQCPEVLIETQGCNAVPCEARDCIVTAWHEWGACSSSCGMGYRTRSRDFKQRPCPGGRGCDLDLAMAEPCYSTSCGCIDCLWDGWTEWSECDKECDGGQASRYRKILNRPQAGCKPCDARTSEQVKPCNTQPCSIKQCVDGQWGDWERWGVCSATCEGGESWRSRKPLLEANECGVMAPGLSMEAKKCNEGVSCIPSSDCLFSDWSRWTECSGRCEGVRQRTRKISVEAKGNGLYCAGSLKQTSPCHNGGGLLDFEDPTLFLNLERLKNNNLGGQGPWGTGGVAGTYPETMRFRNVAELPSVNCPDPTAGGCAGTPIDLEISAKYGYKACDVNDNGRHGSGFGELNVAAGSGASVTFKLVDANTNQPVKARKLMLKIYGLDQGNGGDSQMQVFARHLEDYFLTKDTSIAVASGAGGATFAASNGHSRDKALPQSPTSTTAVEESRSAAILFDDASEVDVNFQVTQGSTCRKFLFAAKACFGAEPCEVDPCHLFDKPAVDCVLSTWGLWGKCSAECGVGQQIRSREIMQQPSRGGFGCSDALSETRECIQKPCHDQCTPVDCLWTDWHEWSACDRCGGQMRRTRYIYAHPVCGGIACHRSAAEEITNCTRQCRDKTFCTWSAWSDYGPCTSTCGAGLQSRERNLHATVEIPGYGSVTDYISGDDMAGMQMKFEELHARTQRMESSRRQVLAMSFGAGCISIAAIFGVVRAFFPSRKTDRTVRHYETINSNA